MTGINRINEVNHPIYGHVRVFDSQDTISRAILQGKEWEPYVAEPMAAAVVAGTDVLDIGAHMGFSTLSHIQRCALQSVWPRVHCFEPQPDIHDLLKYNLRNHPNTRLYAFGLGRCTKILTYEQDPTNTGGTQLRSSAGSAGKHYVAVMALDDLLADDPDLLSASVSVMKIDVEGGESDVLAGAKRFLATHQPKIFIEIQPPLAEEVTRELANTYGYDLEKALGVADYIFRQRGKARPAPTPTTKATHEASIPSVASAPVLVPPREEVSALRDVSLAVPSPGLLCLVLMVKNEESGILATLESFLPFVDACLVYDTGSTDRTRDIVRDRLVKLEDGGNKLRWLVHEETFIDFSASRNRALDIARDRMGCNFTLMPDADDRLSGGWALRAFLQDRAPGPGGSIPTLGDEVDGGYMVNMFGGGTVGDYYLPLVLRVSQGWRYVGKVHEYVNGRQLPNTRIPGVKISKHPTPKSIEATKKRWERDKLVLEAEVEKDPKDARSMFYLAQTLECLGERVAAANMYWQRSQIDGWAEETCEALMRRSRLMENSWGTKEESLQRAHALCPDRAEPLFAIAEHYQVEKNWAMAYLYGVRAASMPMTKASLFVDREVYEWKAAHLVAIVAFYLHQQTGDPEVHATGKRMADRALAARPDDQQRLSNRAWYAQSSAEVFGATTCEIDYKPGIHDGAQYYPSNPSVHYDGKTLRCILRTTNYRIVNGEYLTPNDNVIYTRNVMLELDPALPRHSGSNVLTATDMVDVSSREEWPRSAFPVHGFEDCRLFMHGKTLRATATVCDFDGDKGSREIVLLDIPLDDYMVRRAWPMRGEWSRHHQKNWMPFAMQTPGSWLAVYSTDPLQVFSNSINAAPLPNSGNMGRLRGGSQLIPWRGGEFISDRFIALVHEVTFPGGRDRVYLHRFVEFADEVGPDGRSVLDPIVGGHAGGGGMKVMGMSEPFYFHNRGIEFCAGLARVGDRLIASYGANDCGAFLAVFDAAEVAKRIIPV